MKRMIITALVLIIFCVPLAFAEEYIVKKNQTLADIALRYNISMHKIAQANNRTIGDTIFAGEALIIPTKKPKVQKPEIQTITKTVTRIVHVPIQQEQLSLRDILGLSVAGILILVLIGYGVRRKKSPDKEKEKIRIKIGNEEYDYYPRIKDGKFISLYISGNGSGALLYTEIADLKKSIKASFKKNPVLVKNEKKAGRLILVN